MAERVRELKNEGAYAVLAAAQALERQGRHIVHLEIGQPAYPTPEHVVQAGKVERVALLVAPPSSAIPHVGLVWFGVCGVSMA